MEEPDGSLTVPSIDPEFPCAKPDAATNSNPAAKIEIRVQSDLPHREYRELQKFRAIFSPVPSMGDQRRAWRLCGCVNRAAGKSAVAPDARMRQRLRVQI